MRSARRWVLGAAVAAAAVLSRRADAAWIRVEDRDGIQPVQLVEEHVSVEIRDGAARITTRPVFFNPNYQVLEGEFLMELDPGDAVEGFSMTMGGRKVEAELLDASKARQVYEGIVAKMRDPGLLEYLGTNLLKARIFPIPANGEMEVEVRLTQPVRRNGTMFQVRGLTAARPGAPRALRAASFEAAIDSADPITAIFSPTHPLDIVREGDRKAKVTFRQTGYEAVRPLALYYGTEGKDMGLSFLAHRSDPKAPGTFLATLAPRIELPAGARMPKDVVLVFDTSASMGGEKMDQARTALEYCLGHLAEGDRFGVVDFSTEARRFRETLVEASPDNVKAALAYAHALRARGGTAIDEAIEAGLLLLGKGDPTRLPVLLFLTDGLPTIGEQDPDRILANVAKRNGEAAEGAARARFYVFGVGSDVHTRLLDLLAEKNGGTRDYVDAGEALDARVAGLYDRISAPVLANVRIRAPEGVRVDEVYPRPIPDLFHGGQVFVYGRYEGEGEGVLVLEGTLAGKPRAFEYRVSFSSREERNDHLPRLWAAQKVGFLLDEIKARGAAKELVDEVVEIARAHGIVTPYTSYLVTEDTPLPMPNPWGPVPPPGLMPVPVPEAAVSARFFEEGERDAREGFKGDRVVEKAKKEALARQALTLGTGGGGGAPGEAPRPAAAPAPLAVMDRLADEAYADAGAGAPGGTSAGVSRDRLRHVGAKAFYSKDGIWVDAAFTGKEKVTRVRMFSDEYVRLLRDKPALAKFFALGRVVVVLDGEVWQVDPASDAPPAKP